MYLNNVNIEHALRFLNGPHQCYFFVSYNKITNEILYGVDSPFYVDGPFYHGFEIPKRTGTYLIKRGFIPKNFRWTGR